MMDKAGKIHIPGRGRDKMGPTGSLVRAVRISRDSTVRAIHINRDSTAKAAIIIREIRVNMAADKIISSPTAIMRIPEMAIIKRENGGSAGSCYL